MVLAVLAVVDIIQLRYQKDLVDQRHAQTLP